MDKYIYLLLSLSLLFFWFIIFAARKDLRGRIIKASTVGGFAGVIAEFWYFKDYWQPPSLLGNTTISIEDFLFGFAVTGIAVSVYDVVFRRSNTREFKRGIKLFLLLFLIGVVSLLVFSNWLKINSVFVSSFAFIFFSIVMMILRKDLVIPSFMSGILMVVMITPIYLMLYDWLSPDYWDKYWLLQNTSFGITVLGNIPITEIIWYFSWGCLAGAAYNFVSGEKKIALAKDAYSKPKW